MILSSSALKNININEKDDDFIFNFGDKKILMKVIFAEFISPFVSKIRKSDPTFNTISFNNLIQNVFPSSDTSKNNLNELFDDETTALIHQLSCGNEIEVNESQSNKMRLISILLGNEELYDKINNFFPLQMNISNIEQHFNDLMFLFNLSKHSTFFFNFYQKSKIIDFIANNFYLIDKQKLISLPKTIIYEIINNDKLILENEDSLLDFIYQIYSNKTDEDVDIIEFYELVEFTSLSETSMHQFLTKFTYDEMSNKIWQKINQYIRSQFTMNKYTFNPENHHYLYKDYIYIEYDGNENNRFKGLINHLTNQCNGNVYEKGIIDIKSTKEYEEKFNNSHHSPQFVVDLNNRNYYHSICKEGAWLKYDFKDRKVHPTKYSIRSRNEDGGNLLKWVIQGSNIGNDEDGDEGWITLDSRNDESIKENDSSNTFNISAPIDKNQYFRYLRIKANGLETRGLNCLIFSALEFFGSMFSEI